MRPSECRERPVLAGDARPLPPRPDSARSKYTQVVYWKTFTYITSRFLCNLLIRWSVDPSNPQSEIRNPQSGAAQPLFAYSVVNELSAMGKTGLAQVSPELVEGRDVPVPAFPLGSRHSSSCHGVGSAFSFELAASREPSLRSVSAFSFQLWRRSRPPLTRHILHLRAQTARNCACHKGHKGHKDLKGRAIPAVKRFSFCLRFRTDAYRSARAFGTVIWNRGSPPTC